MVNNKITNVRDKPVCKEHRAEIAPKSLENCLVEDTALYIPKIIEDSRTDLSRTSLAYSTWFTRRRNRRMERRMAEKWANDECI